MRTSLMLLTIVFPLLALPTVVTAKEPPDKKILKEAKEKLKGPGEGTVREGAHLCLKQNNVQAAELLLDILDADQPHRRDIVWEVIPLITDPYARKRIEKEVRSNKKNARVRQWCAQALGLFDDGAFASTLEKALVDKAPFVKAAALKSLGQIGRVSAASKIKALTRHKDLYVRSNAYEALARIDPVKWRDQFASGMSDEDGGVRCALLGAAPEIYADETETLSKIAMTDPDWRVRLQAVDNLMAAKSKTAIDVLVPTTEDVRPAVANRAIDFLQKISGLKFTMRVQWVDWWRANRETFSFPEGNEVVDKSVVGTSRVSFNGLPVTSDHVAFVIDKSHGMTQKSLGEEVKNKKARKELADTLSHLHGEDFVFNVVTYGAAFHQYEDEPVVLDKKTEKAALEFVDGVRCAGNKAIWDILEKVVSDPDIDTIYLLSSGEPEIGLYVHFNRVTEHLAELNRFHKVVVHTVAYTDSKWNQDQLKEISAVSGGKFVIKP